LIWQEVQALTKPNNNDPEAAFLQEMFSHIPQGKKISDYKVNRNLMIYFWFV
jgi:hypothetical protein